jgi:hypothetical protein
VKRILIFLLIGPAVGYAIYLLWQLSIGRSVGGAEGVLLGLPFAYIFGVLPTLVIGSVDRLLQEKISLWPRIMIVALVGYCASIAMMSVWTAVPFPLPQLLSFGSVGAVQGAVCSWLSRCTHVADVTSVSKGA